jgi:hypothetical protein
MQITAQNVSYVVKNLLATSRCLFSSLSNKAAPCPRFLSIFRVNGATKTTCGISRNIPTQTKRGNFLEPSSISKNGKEAPKKKDEKATHCLFLTENKCHCYSLCNFCDTKLRNLLSLCFSIFLTHIFLPKYSY